MFTPIRTDRLVIRPWREDEAPRLLDILRRPEIVKWLGHPKTLDTVEEARTKIAGMADDLPKSEWAFEVAQPDDQTGVPAGSVMLVDIPHSEQPDGSSLVQIGWYAHPDATGQDYTTEAAHAVLAYGLAAGLPEIRALTHTDNYPSMHLYDGLRHDVPRHHRGLVRRRPSPALHRAGRGVARRFGGRAAEPLGEGCRPPPGLDALGRGRPHGSTSECASSRALGGSRKVRAKATRTVPAPTHIDT